MNELTTHGRLGKVRATAYGKLTVALMVKGRRDDGFHDLETLAVSIADPHDIVQLTAVPHPGGITFSIEGETDGVPANATNLAYRGADDVMLAAGRSGHGVVMELRKKIPAARGLGGGSADAAAAMLAVRKMLDIDVDDERLMKIAAGLGSDVPFCLTGGAAWLTGRGEILEPVALAPGAHFLVAIPPFPLSTEQVYAKWDELGGPQTERRFPVHPGPLREVLDEHLNDLEPAAEALEPRIRPFRERLEESAGLPAVLAGSGSAYAVPLPVEVDDQAGLARRVSRQLKVPVVAARTVSRGVRLG